MADQIAVVESAAELVAASRVAVPQRICAGSVFLGLAAIAGLYAGSGTGRTVSGMTVILALMLVAVQGFVAFLAASPGLVGTSPHGGLAVAAVAAASDGLRTWWAGARMAEDNAFVLTTFQGSPAFISAGMRSLPRVKNWIYLLGAIACVPVWDLSLFVLCPAFRAAPCVASRRSALNLR